MIYAVFGIVVVIIVSFIIRHFKAVSKRVFVAMDISTSIANMVGYFYIIDKENISPQIFGELTKSEKYDERVARIAAITNYLYARDINPTHKNMFLNTDIQKSAYELLDKDELLRELVVQSVRMIHLVQFRKSKTQMRNGYDVLQKYGPLVPISPNPDSYRLLVKKCLSLLSPGYKENITQYIMNTWPKFYNQYYLT